MIAGLVRGRAWTGCLAAKLLRADECPDLEGVLCSESVGRGYGIGMGT